MIKSYLDKAVLAGLFAILAVAPSQLAINLKGAYVSVADPLILVVGILWGISRLLALRKAFDLRPILPPYENMAFIILVALSVLKAADKFASVKELVQLIEYLIVAFLIFAKGVRTRQTLTHLLYTFLALTSIAVVIGALHYVDSSRDILDVKSTFGNRNVLGGYLSISLPVALAVLVCSEKWKIRLWMGAILTVGLLINLAGGSFLAVILGGFLICLQKSTRATLGWCIYLAIIMCLILPWMPRKNPEVLMNSVRIYDEDVQVEPRYTEWQASLEMWNEEPLLGVGIGNYQRQVGTFYGYLPMPQGGKEPDHNNLFLVLLSSTGIIGLLGLILMLALWFRKALVSYWQSQDQLQKTFALAVCGVLVAFSVNCVWTALIIRGVFPCLIIIVALLYAFDQLTPSSKQSGATEEPS